MNFIILTKVYPTYLEFLMKILYIKYIYIHTHTYICIWYTLKIFIHKYKIEIFVIFKWESQILSFCFHIES